MLMAAARLAPVEGPENMPSARAAWRAVSNAWAWYQFDLGPERPHRADLLVCERVGGHDPQRVTLHRADERQRRAGAPTGVLHDQLARPQAAGGLRGLDHRQGHPVLGRTGRVGPSIFTQTSAQLSSARCPSRTTGVPPMAEVPPGGPPATSIQRDAAITSVRRPILARADHPDRDGRRRDLNPVSIRSERRDISTARRLFTASSRARAKRTATAHRVTDVSLRRDCRSVLTAKDLADRSGSRSQRAPPEVAELRQMGKPPTPPRSGSASQQSTKSRLSITIDSC
jgi:hypothetical protein